MLWSRIKKKSQLGENKEQQLHSIRELLLTADFGVSLSSNILSQLNNSNNQDKHAALKDILLQLLTALHQSYVIHESLHVIMLVGINGVGKTTTAAKLAHYFTAQGKKTILAAGDTFRAAAIEQLQAWGRQLNVPVIAQMRGADSAAVLFDAMSAASARKADVLIADTAGRLENKSHLLRELQKNVNVLHKHNPAAPHQILLVVDANTGQNMLHQIEEFKKIINITGIICTKLDGSAKAGSLFSLATGENTLPIYFITTGESSSDIALFDPVNFVNRVVKSRVS